VKVIVTEACTVQKVQEFAAERGVPVVQAVGITACIAAELNHMRAFCKSSCGEEGQ
jgi:hypothetical protein